MVRQRHSRSRTRLVVIPKIVVLGDFIQNAAVVRMSVLIFRRTFLAQAANIRVN